MKTIVIMNTAHSLMEEQQNILATKFPEGYEVLGVPAEGWNLEQLREIAYSLVEKQVVFVSPVPVLIGLTAKAGIETYIFHNDKRDKKELPNGKIIMVVSQTGCELVLI